MPWPALVVSRCLRADVPSPAAGWSALLQAEALCCDPLRVLQACRACLARASHAARMAVRWTLRLWAQKRVVGCSATILLQPPTSCEFGAFSLPFASFKPASSSLCYLYSFTASPLPSRCCPATFQASPSLTRASLLRTLRASLSSPSPGAFVASTTGARTSSPTPASFLQMTSFWSA